MKIITLTSTTGCSGGVRQAEYQTACLRAMGHDALLCLPDDSSMWGGGHVQEGWIRLPPGEFAWRSALESLFDGGPTVVHAFHNRAVKLAAWWGLSWRRRGVVCVAHRGIITRPKNPLPYWSPGIRYFLVNSHACARSLGWYCPASRIRYIPNGVPDERVIPAQSAAKVRAKLGLDGAGLVLGYIGNANPVKGTDVLLKAFALAGRWSAEAASARLVMVGAPSEVWLSMARAEGVESQVRVIPQVLHVSDILQVCDAFVFPSRGMDSAPNVLLEAVRMGLPVVSTNVGGCPDIMDGNGLVVPAGKVEPLASALTVMCGDEDRRRAWAVQSHIVGARYTEESRCKALLEVYEEILRPRGGARAFQN